MAYPNEIVLTKNAYKTKATAVAFSFLRDATDSTVITQGNDGIPLKAWIQSLINNGGISSPNPPVITGDAATYYQDNTGSVIPGTLVDPTIPSSPIDGDNTLQQYDNGVVSSVYNSGIWTNTAILNAIAQVNIYNASGTLTGNRTLFGNSLNMTFQDISTFTLNSTNRSDIITTSGLLSGSLTSQSNQATVRVTDGVSTNHNVVASLVNNGITFKGDLVGVPYSYVFPKVNGTVNQALLNNGAGILNWGDVALNNIYTADGTLTGNRVLTTNANTLEFDDGFHRFIMDTAGLGTRFTYDNGAGSTSSFQQNTIGILSLNSSDGGTNQSSITVSNGLININSNSATSTSILRQIATGTEITGEFMTSGTITSAAIATKTPDLAITGLDSSTLIELNFTVDTGITGLDSTGIVAGSRKILINVGSENGQLFHEDASSSANNRFSCPGEVVYNFPKGASVEIVYDDFRWRVQGTGHNIRIDTEGTGNINAEINSITPVDVSGGTSTITPPTTTVPGSWFGVSDSRSNSATNNITVDFTTAGDNYYGVGSSNAILSTNGMYMEFVYVNATVGWIAKVN